MALGEGNKASDIIGSATGTALEINTVLTLVFQSQVSIYTEVLSIGTMGSKCEQLTARQQRDLHVEELGASSFSLNLDQVSQVSQCS